MSNTALNLQPVEAAARRRSLLIVDDEELQRTFLGEVARRAGFDVADAATMQEAEMCMVQRPYDAVIVDLSLGNHDGVEVIRSIADRDQKPQLIVISGCEDRIRDAVISFAKAAGFPTLGELRKPLDIVRFKQTIAGITSLTDRKAEPKFTQPVIWREDIQAAIANGDIFTVYQPQVSMKTGGIVGIEALSRWNHKTYGSIPPVVFIPLADKFDLSGPLTTAVLNRTISAASGWCKKMPALRVAVNVPANVLLDVDFPDEVMEILAKYNMPPDNLVIEVTESTALSDVIVHADVMCRLRIKRINLSLDDFGTGYSSLVALRRFPFSEVKIDREFVSNADRDPYSWEIVKGTVAMASAMGLRTVAEGVETQTVADMLTKQGVDVGQGWLYARPAVWDEIQKEFA